MKIGILINDLPMGGLEKVTIFLANALCQKYDVSLIILDDKSNNYQLDNNLKIIEGYIKYKFLNKLIRKILRITTKKHEYTCWKEINFLKKIIKENKYDVIIASGGNNSMIINHVKKKYKNETDFPKIISWVHNSYDSYFNISFKLFKEDLKKSLENSDYVVTLTKKDQNDYLQHNSNTFCIYNPLTINKAKITKLENKEILFVARLVKHQKGLDYLIEIAKKIKHTDWIIKVVGDGSDKEWLSNKIKENNLEKKVILEGEIKENIEDIYAGASLFISTSRWEGFGLVITEAMASGLPVISFCNTGPNEILDNNKYGMLIKKGDVDDFSKNIKYIINNKDKLLHYHLKSLERVEDFKIETIIKTWEELLFEKKVSS